MKAAVIEQFSSSLVVREIGKPMPGPDEVLVRVRACGLCGTDLKILAGKFSRVSLPHIPGHEIAGEICEVGERVNGIKAGDRVVVYIYLNCGKCRYCRAGRDSLCENLKGQIGFTVDGGMAEFVKVPASNILPLGNTLPFAQAAALPDAVATVYHALYRRTEVKKGDVLIVVGAGGLGLHAVQIAKILGARVFAVDIQDTHLEKALSLGADHALHPEHDNIQSIIQKETGRRGAEVVIDLVGHSATIEQDLKWLCPGGKLLVVGYNLENTFSVSSHFMIRNEVEILGCRAMSFQDLADVITLAQKNRISPVVDQILPLDAVNDAYERLRRGKTLGRLVLEPAAGTSQAVPT